MDIFKEMAMSVKQFEGCCSNCGQPLEEYENNEECLCESCYEELDN